MSVSGEISITCPRTGIPCPFLMERAADVQEGLDVIDYAREMYSEAATTAALVGAEFEIYSSSSLRGHVAITDEVISGYGALQQALEAVQILRARQIEAEEDLIEHNKKGAQLAEASCIGGPWVIRRHVIYGPKKLTCVSLFALVSQEKE